MSQESKGLRVLTGLVGLLSVLALAWVAQDYLLGRSRVQRSRSADLLGEGTGDFPAQARPEPWGHAVLGLPSGAEPLQAPHAREPLGTSPTRPEVTSPVPASRPRWPADLELVIRPGQSLSKIAAAEYGRATPRLVALLAKYNNLANANALRAGQSLRIPVKAKLLETE